MECYGFIYVQRVILLRSDNSLADIDPNILGKEERFIGPAAVFDEEGSTKVVVPTYSAEATSDVPTYSSEATSDVPTYISEVTSTYPLVGTSDVATSPSEIK